MFCSTIPVVVFFSTLNLLCSIGFGALLELGQMLLTLLAALAVMFLIYLLIILFNAKLDPITFIRKYAPTMWNTFLSGSGLAAMPRTIRCCRNNLGVSPQVYSFSIPFGATVNMDGNCIYLTITGLFLARLCGVELLGSDMLSLIFTVVVLSVGAPITYGTVFMCMTVLLTQMNVSLAAISMIIGINALVEMLLGMSNTVGDVAITLSVASSEGLIDRDVYYSKGRIRR